MAYAMPEYSWLRIAGASVVRAETRNGAVQKLISNIESHLAPTPAESHIDTLFFISGWTVPEMENFFANLE